MERSIRWWGLVWLLICLPRVAAAAGGACPLRATVGDAAALATAPARWDGEAWSMAAAGVGAVGLTALLDRRLAGQWPGNDWLAEIGNGYALVAPVAAIAWYGGHGWLTRDPAAVRTGANVAEAAVLAVAATELLKVAVGRERPAGDSTNHRRFHPGNFSERRTSFPSGHTALAFATAATVQDADLPTAVKVGAYGLATLTAWSRLHDERHWLSDVVGGGLIGYGVGRFVARRHPTPTEHASHLTPWLAEGRVGVAWERRF